MTISDVSSTELPPRKPCTVEESAMTQGIRRSRLADQAYEVLKDRILTQQLLPGQRLSVPAIAEELQLSRSPVREAVQRLVQEGLGSERPHQGAVVASADLRSLVDLYVVRATLEGLSAELAAGADVASLVTDLEEIQREHENAYADGAGATVIRADMRFHARILQASGNAELIKVVGPILQRMSLAMLAGEQTWPAHALAEHRAVIDAFKQSDAGGARTAMIAHIQRVRSDLRAKLGESQKQPREVS